MTNSSSLYRTHDIEEVLIQSNRIAQTYKIRIYQPIMRSDNSERFPVLYATDSDKLFGGLAALANELQVFGETRRFILVGIGYANSRAADLLRMRDLFTHGIRARLQSVLETLANSPLVQGIDDLSAITNTTDAADFLRFVREELMPFVGSHFPALPDDNNYFGYSAGGTFGLYTLFTQPDTFRSYILSSPGTSYNGHHFGVELAKPFLATGRPLNAKVFMSVGELEEFYAQFNLTTGYYLMAKYLKDAAVPGLDLKLRVFPDEPHASVWALGFSHGVRVLFSPEASSPYRPEFD